MYEVAGAEADGPVRAGDPFPVTVVLCCRGEGCAETDVTVSIDGVPVVEAQVAAAPGECVEVTPPAQPSPTAASWVSLPGNGAVVVDDPGSHSLAVVADGQYVERGLVVGPSRGRPVGGRPLDYGGTDG